MDLPPYNSRQTDNYGFYNGKNYANILINQLKEYRTASLPHCKAEILTRLTYPTGGWSEFTYELNAWSRIQDPFAQESGRIRTGTGNGGGLRIQRIRDFNGQSFSDRTFSYVDSSGTSTGILSGEPFYIAEGHIDDTKHYASRLFNLIGNLFSHDWTYVIDSERGVSQLSQTDGRVVTYDTVKETFPDGGSVTYSYTNCADYPDAADGSACTNIDNVLINNPISSYEVARGLLKETVWKNTEGDIVRKESNVYSMDDECVRGIVKEYVFAYIRRIASYRILTTFPFIRKKTVTTYPEIGGTPLVEVTEYEYGDYRNLSSETRYVRYSPSIRTEYRYPGDFRGSPYWDMIIAGQVGVPIERRKLNSDMGILLEDELLVYKNFDGKYLPWKHYVAPLGAGVDLSSWTAFESGAAPSGYGPEVMVITARDNLGNPTQVDERNGVRTLWAWDAAGMYPLTKTTKGSNAFDPSLTESFTWDSYGKGLASKTDARGVSESYEYDTLGRLIRISDSSGSTVKRFEYAYGPEGNLVREISFNNAEATDSTVVDKRFDGLGREWRTVQAGGSPSGGDLSTLQEYDLCGRPVRSWLPVPTSASTPDAFKAASLAAYGDSCAFTAVQYDDSPLDLPRKTVGAGAAWHGADKGVTVLRGANEDGPNAQAELKCMLPWLLEEGDSLVLMNGGLQTGGTYAVERTEDEDNNVLLVFTDLEGRTVLERRILDPTSGTIPVFADTYFLYDDAGRLLLVIPPELSKRVNASGWNGRSEAGVKAIADYAFRYEYDSRNRCTAKKLPGAEWIRYAYDKGDRLIFSQDGNQRERGVWSFSIPDALGRPCVSGEAERLTTDDAENYLNNNVISTNRPTGGILIGLKYGYRLNGISDLTSSYDIQDVRFWDKYTFVGKTYQGNGATFPSDLFGTTKLHDEPRYDHFSNAEGLMTGRISAPLGTLPDSTVTDWNKTVWYYNAKGSITRQTDGYGGGHVVRETTGYDFRELPVSRCRILNPGGSGSVREQYTYTYDRWSRPLVTTHSLDGGTSVTLASNPLRCARPARHRRARRLRQSHDILFLQHLRLDHRHRGAALHGAYLL